MAMAGEGGSRLDRVRLWVAEESVARALPASMRLLCETAVIRLAVSGATLTLDSRQAGSETWCATDRLGAQLAELEVTVGEGPGLDARRAGGPVLVSDLDTTANQRRWPLFAPLAVETGAAAIFTLPLCVGAIRVGILALHRVEARPLDATTVAYSLAFAELTLRLLLDEQAGVPTVDGGLPLHSPQVHQATGMIAGQLAVGMADAFARLRARAFADGRPLADLAADVVARRIRFSPAIELP